TSSASARRTTTCCRRRAPMRRSRRRRRGGRAGRRRCGSCSRAQDRGRGWTLLQAAGRGWTAAPTGLRYRAAGRGWTAAPTGRRYRAAGRGWTAAPRAAARALPGDALIGARGRAGAVEPHEVEHRLARGALESAREFRRAIADDDHVAVRDDAVEIAVDQLRDVRYAVQDVVAVRPEQV